MLALADFLDSILRGGLLAAAALVWGGLAWTGWVLQPRQRHAPAAAVRLALTLSGWGAASVALAQVLLLALKALALAESFGSGALGSFVATPYFTAAAARAVLAIALAVAIARLRRAPGARDRWLLAAALAAGVAGSGAWLTHATGRLEERAPLMALTVLHQVAASVWAGGLAQLAGCWWLARRAPEVDAAWPALIRRFSRLAMAAVAVAVLAALPLTGLYTASLGGLVGTGYGALVLTKVALLGAALALAAANLRAARAGAEPAPLAALRTRLPQLAEAEAIIVAAILFTAAALSAQPPPVDQPAADQATLPEIAEVFRPKVPSLRTPTLSAMGRSRREVAAGGERSRDAYLWSNYSHNVAGLILLGVSLVALAGATVRPTWRRHWPLGFVALAAFVYLRAAANEGTWPFGAVPLRAIDAEGIQHRIGAVLGLALGLLEWRARAGRGGPLPYVFPALAAAGAALLLTHSHAAFQSKSSFLVQVTHTTMGALAALLVAARWLELRLAAPAGRLAGAAAAAAMLAIALILVFYREANIVIPPD